MAGFPSSRGSNPKTLQRALDNLLDYAGTVKVRTQGLRNDSAAGPIDAAAVISYLRDLVALRAQMVSIAAMPGISAHAQTALNSASLNIATEYTAMTAAISNVISWIAANFPKDANGFLLYEQIDGQGGVVLRSLSTAQTSGLRTQLDALLSTID